MKKLHFLFLLILAFALPSKAQITVEKYRKDTVLTQQSAVSMRQSFLFSTNSIGGQMGIGKLLKQKEIHRFKKSGYEKIATKSRFLYGNIGYYYQPDFQHNWSLTADYTLSRTSKNGFYSEFSPFLGISRTFLTATTYTVGDSGNVTKKHLAGNWYLTSGFSTGLGVNFRQPKWASLKTIAAKLVVQTFYPNFRFIAIKPYFQLQTAWELPKKQTNFTKKIKFKN